MSDQSQDLARPTHNPFDAPATKASPVAWLVAIGIVVLLHAGLVLYLYKMRFTIKERVFEDEKLDTQLIKPPPPLPLPPVPDRKPQPPEPPRVAPPAPPEPPRNPVIENPSWDRKPSGDDVARYYPDRALRREISGRATISCTVRANGTVTGCSVVSEDPADYGFGDAAIKLSSRFRMKPKRADGTPVEGGTVRIPIVFRMPEG